MKVRISARWLLPGLVLALALPLDARAASPKSSAEKAEAGEIVDLFDGMKSGDLEVRYIPKDARAGTLHMTNKTGKPLRVKLPETFAAVPVLAQFGGGGGGFGGGGQGGGGFGGGGQGGGGGGGQGLGGGGLGGGGGGGGLGGGGGGLGGGGGGGGLFNLAPDKVAKLKATTVCLEHGKPDPRSTMKYTIVPLGDFTQDREIHELCAMIHRGEISQVVAQIVAWHANGLSWEELAAKDKKRLSNGYSEKYFTPGQVAVAARLKRELGKRTESAASSSESAASSSVKSSLARQ